MIIRHKLNLATSMRSHKGRQREAIFRRFTLAFLAAAIMPMLTVGLVNIAVDPYGVFNTPSLANINQWKPEKWKYQRLFKAIAITRLKPVTVFLGSSRTNLGLNPAYSGLKDHQPAYNLGLNGANTYEALRYLQHTIKNQQNLELVVLGVDFIMFNESLGNQPGFWEGRLEKQSLMPQDAVNTVFSLDTLSSSQKTLAVNQAKLADDIYYPNGFMRLQREEKQTIFSFKQALSTYFTVHDSYQLSTQYLEDLKAIVELCQQQNISLVVFISPAHATHWEAIQVAGQWKIFEQWKREVAEIVPVWDFSGYNSVTTEPLSENMTNYIDSSHYSEKVGNLVLSKILSERQEAVPKDFGVLLTPENIESHLAKVRGDRKIWLGNRSEELQLVREIKAKLKTKEKDY